MRLLTFTEWPSAISSKKWGRPSEKTWDEWGSVFSQHDRRGPVPNEEDPDVEKSLRFHKGGRCFVPGVVEGSRCDAHVHRLDAFVADIDSISDEQIAEMYRAIRPFAWLCYSTHRHGFRGKNKLRFIFPLASPIDDKRHFAQAWSTLAQTLTLGLADRQARAFSNLFYFPSTWEGNDNVIFHRNDGGWVSPPETAAATVLTNETPSSNLRALVSQLASRKGDNAKTAKRLLEGKPLAKEGGRHDSIVKITHQLALMAVSTNGSSPATPDEIEAIFAPSMDAMRHLDPSFSDDPAGAYASAVAKISERTSKYSDEEMAAIVEAQGESLKWIVHKDPSYWILAEGGDYAGPFTYNEMNSVVYKMLARAPIDLMRLDSHGNLVRKNISRLVEDYGFVPSKISIDLAAERSRVVGREFRESIIRLRDLEPRFDPEIDSWLKGFAGPQYEKILDWMACAPDLNKMLCALYFCGPKSTGKTLFAVGMARLWTMGSPTQGDEIFASDFNESLLQCPLVLADETIPKRYMRQNATEIIRSLTSITFRKINRKYRTPADALGALRMIICANNEGLLSTSTMTADDIEAVAEKVLFVSCERSTLDQLPLTTKERWAQDGIARHALWLRENREVIPPSRFWVEGSMSDMTRHLLFSNDWINRVCECLVRYLQNPASVDAKGDGFILREDGKLYVNPQGIIDNWSLFFKDTRVEPEAAKIGAAIRSISLPGTVKKRVGSRRPRYYVIDSEFVRSWSRQKMIGDETSIEAGLVSPVGEPAEVETETETDDKPRRNLFDRLVDDRRLRAGEVHQG